jgi:hypothetical protein
VHLGGRGGNVLAADEEDEGDPAAAAGVAVLEDGDTRDTVELGEEEVEVGVGEREIQVGHTHCRLGRREATRTPTFAVVPTPELATSSPGALKEAAVEAAVEVEGAVIVAI